MGACLESPCFPYHPNYLPPVNISYLFLYHHQHEANLVFANLHVSRYLNEIPMLLVPRPTSARSAFCATCVSAESVARAKESEGHLMSTWKWGSDDPKAFFGGEWCQRSSDSLKGH